MICPRCTEPLEEKGGAHDRHMCPAGHGRFLDSGETRALLEDKLHLTPQFIKDLAEQFQTHKALTCMQCAQPMRIIQLKGAWVDLCFGCGGMWLDTGELPLLDPSIELAEGLTDLYSPAHSLAAIPVVAGQIIPTGSNLAPWHDKKGRPGMRQRTWPWMVPLTLLLPALSVAIALGRGNLADVLGSMGPFALMVLGLNIWGSHQVETIMDKAQDLFLVKYRALWKWSDVELGLHDIDHISLLQYVRRSRYGKYNVYRIEASTRLGQQIPLTIYRTRFQSKARKQADRLNRLLKSLQSETPPSPGL